MKGINDVIFDSVLFWLVAYSCFPHGSALDDAEDDANDPSCANKAKERTRLDVAKQRVRRIQRIKFIDQAVGKLLKPI